MKNNKLLTGVAFNILAGFAIALIAGIAPIAGIGIAMSAGYAMHKVNNGVAFDGLAKEVWIPLVKEDFYPSTNFLSAATDMSSLVNNDAINYAEAGADPAVLKNNTTYPVGSTDASDSPKAVDIDYYDTESTVVRNAVAIELAYDQRLLYANKHKKALLKKITNDAAYAYSPTQNSSVNKNTVLNLESGDSVIDAVIDLQRAYNDVDADMDDRNLILSPIHMAYIAKEDKVLYKSIMAEPGNTFYSFKIWNSSQLPIYVAATGVRAAQGAAFVNGTHKYASVGFMGSEVMKAMGTVEMFSKLKDPDIKGDKFNFQMRFLAAALRDKFRCAILKA